jgi:hypothetical protein
MSPMLPPPTLIVDTWGFRLADPQGNLIGRQPGAIIDTVNNVVTLPPANESVVRALPAGQG